MVLKKPFDDIPNPNLPKSAILANRDARYVSHLLYKQYDNERSVLRVNYKRPLVFFVSSHFGFIGAPFRRFPIHQNYLHTIEYDAHSANASSLAYLAKNLAPALAFDCDFLALMSEKMEKHTDMRARLCSDMRRGSFIENNPL